MNLKHRYAQLAGRASAELHIYLYFKKIGPQECDCIITRIRLTKRGQVALHVLSSRYGVEGVVTIPKGWSFDETRETVTDITNSTTLTIFDHVMVKICADDTYFRFRTVFEYIRRSNDLDIKSNGSEKEQRLIQNEMFS
jgi:exosome complex exonuclease DIS3/RRP44